MGPEMTSYDRPIITRVNQGLARRTPTQASPARVTATRKVTVNESEKLPLDQQKTHKVTEYPNASARYGWAISVPSFHKGARESLPSNGQEYPVKKCILAPNRGLCRR